MTPVTDLSPLKASSFDILRKMKEVRERERKMSFYGDSIRTRIADNALIPFYDLIAERKLGEMNQKKNSFIELELGTKTQFKSTKDKGKLHK